MNDEKSLRAGVIGVGHMGKYHARVYSELSSVELAWVADEDTDRAAEIADKHGTSTFTNKYPFDTVDIVSIAVPTPYHAEIAEEAIEAGVHTLIEKPFVKDTDKGEYLVKLADEHGVIVQIGHIERFNPAVSVLSDILSQVNLIAFDAKRLGPPTGRNVNDDVITDLMIHDLDIVLSLANSSVSSADAFITNKGQYASASLQFEDAVIGTFVASRVTQKKVRELTVTTDEFVVYLDYMNKSVEIHHQSLPSYADTSSGITHRNENVIEEVLVENHEPLKAEIESFVHAVRGEHEPVVSATDGLRVVGLIEELVGAAGKKPASSPLETSE